MSDACRLVKIERGSDEFETIAVACGWDSGNEMYDELAEELESDVNDLYIAAEEVGYRESKRGLKVYDEVNILNFIGDQFGNRYFINRIEAYMDKNGKLWADEQTANEF